MQMKLKATRLVITDALRDYCQLKMDKIEKYLGSVAVVNCDVEISKTIPTTKKVKKFKLDPYQEIPDIDTSDNVYPKEPEAPTKFQLFKQRSFQQGSNPMQEARQEKNAGVGSSGKN